jgi:hypothetical protein
VKVCAQYQGVVSLGKHIEERLDLWNIIIHCHTIFWMEPEWLFIESHNKYSKGARLMAVIQSKTSTENDNKNEENASV